ncbi:hypothetical protein [Bradyrhizobium sp. LTSPM299]|uniref:hypothetical protein n=1 Tax=Bradyrhizobium sp. LTSPM299 TaxID=1619233 RepID=UPI001FD906EA|nr:hypothetical protein [Bradyrhizobium sp. LTSPM299]
MPRSADRTVLGAGATTGLGCFRTKVAFGAFLAARGFGAAGFTGGGVTASTACFFGGAEAAFFGAFLTAFLAVFFAADFLTAFFVVFFAFLTIRLLVLAARFFAVVFLVARAGEAFFVLAFFLDDFVLAATTDSFADQNKIVGIEVRRSVYRVASASMENTEKTSGLRSRL